MSVGASCPPRAKHDAGTGTQRPCRELSPALGGRSSLQGAAGAGDTTGSHPRERPAILGARV